MVKLQVCDCGSTSFSVITGQWVVWGMDGLVNPVTMLCQKCGDELLTATWTGKEDDPSFVQVPEDVPSATIKCPGCGKEHSSGHHHSCACDHCAQSYAHKIQ